MRGSKVALIAHMKNKGSITSSEAFQEYGVTRLAACIFDLRSIGYDIDTIMMETTTRFGEPTRYAKYILKGEPKKNA